MTIAAVAILYFFLLVAAVIVGLARKRMGTFSLRGIAISVLGLISLTLGGFIDLWGTFLLAGGPDGQFLSKNTLLVGGACTLLALLIIFLALRLLSMPGAWAALFLLPPMIAIGGQAARVWPITLAAFSAGPALCLITIVTLWMRRELRSHNEQVAQNS